jgi:N-acyl-D-aspartate/D-glutamate deacylase
MAHDRVIRAGEVVDGTGSEPVVTDVAILENDEHTGIRAGRVVR